MPMWTHVSKAWYTEFRLKPCAFLQGTNYINTCLPPLPTFVYLCTHKVKASCWCCKRSRIEVKVNPGFYHRLKKENREIGKAFLLRRQMQQTTTLLVLLPLLWYFGTPQFNIYLFIPKRKTREDEGEKIIIKKITEEKFPKLTSHGKDP